MDAVIKVGGSLAADSTALTELCKTLADLAEKYHFLVVPGGGEFADAVREVDKRYSLSSVAAHRMAILGMDQYGLLLSGIIPNSQPVQNLDEAAEVSQLKRVPVLLPSLLMFREKGLEASWDVTSDSIAAYVACRLDMRRLVLVTDVDGVFTRDPKAHFDAVLLKEVRATELLKLESRTSVDRYLPRMLLQMSMDCFVVNGIYPERIRLILAGHKTRCTRIVAK